MVFLNLQLCHQLNETEREGGSHTMASKSVFVQKHWANVRVSVPSKFSSTGEHEGEHHDTNDAKRAT